jgi:hypothetical protein
LEKLWDRNIQITTRLVDTVSTPMLLKTLHSAHKPHGLDPKPLITHHFKLDQILEAYETFGHTAKTHALKVIIETCGPCMRFQSIDPTKKRRPSCILIWPNLCDSYLWARIGHTHPI